MRTYHLFQQAPLLGAAGTVIKLALNQLEVAKLIYDPKAPMGVAAAPEPAEKTAERS
jgi:hypothetical protein